MLQVVGEKDVQAFVAAIQRHERELLSFAFRLTGREDAARDALQDSLLKAYEALREGATPENLRAWLYRLTYNTIIDRSRRAAVEERAQARLRSESDRRAPKSISEELEAIIRDVPAPYKEILYLRYAHEFTFSEMESILSTSAATLRVYAARALEMVHERMREKSHGV